MTEKKRTYRDIWADILEVARAGAIKTRIVYLCNLNFGIVWGYLSSLKDMGHLDQDGRLYRTTDKGLDYLSRYHYLRKAES